MSLHRLTTITLGVPDPAPVYPVVWMKLPAPKLTLPAVTLPLSTTTRMFPPVEIDRPLVTVSVLPITSM